MLLPFWYSTFICIGVCVNGFDIAKKSRKSFKVSVAFTCEVICNAKNKTNAFSVIPLINFFIFVFLNVLINRVDFSLLCTACFNQCLYTLLCFNFGANQGSFFIVFVKLAVIVLILLGQQS